MPTVSVIIPCYNQGSFIDEAVDSILAQTYKNYEIIIINDGSTDDNTNQLLANYKRPQTTVYLTPNQGLAEARNYGIRNAIGEYILPLDADDRIAPTYLEQAIKILVERPIVGIVYCLAETFGAVSKRWLTPEYSLQRMLLGNLIFCSACFRRNDWERTGGYRKSLSSGWEDWDLWLSIIEQGREVYRIPEVLFFYRIKENSMATSMSAPIKAEMHHQIIRNHQELFVENALPLLSVYYRVTSSRLYRIIKCLRLPYLFGRIMASGNRGKP